MENPGKAAGIILTIIGVVMEIIGGLAYIWGELHVETTPGGWFSDPVTTTYMTYPFREMGTWLLAMGFIAILAGIAIYVSQQHVQKQVVVEKVKVRCQYCGNLMDETEIQCPGCGAR